MTVVDRRHARRRQDAGPGVIPHRGQDRERPTGVPPPPPDAIWMKFEDCTAAALPPADQRRMFDRLQHADALAGVHELPVTSRRALSCTSRTES